MKRALIKFRELVRMMVDHDLELARLESSHKSDDSELQRIGLGAT